MLSEMAHYHLILTLTVLSLMRQYLFPIQYRPILTVNGLVIFRNYSTVCQHYLTTKTACCLLHSQQN